MSAEILVHEIAKAMRIPLTDVQIADIASLIEDYVSNEAHNAFENPRIKNVDERSLICSEIPDEDF